MEGKASCLWDGTGGTAPKDGDGAVWWVSVWMEEVSFPLYMAWDRDRWFGPFSKHAVFFNP